MAYRIGFRLLTISPGFESWLDCLFVHGVENKHCNLQASQQVAPFEKNVCCVLLIIFQTLDKVACRWESLLTQSACGLMRVWLINAALSWLSLARPKIGCPGLGCRHWLCPAQAVTLNDVLIYHFIHKKSNLWGGIKQQTDYLRLRHFRIETKGWTSRNLTKKCALKQT